MLKKIFKITALVLASFILLIGIYFLSAFSLSRISVDKEQSDAGDVMIYILSNGVHTDLVVPVKTKEIDWSKRIPYRDTKSNDTTAHWLALGWGDKGFYLETPTWADLKYSTAFKAAFALSHSAIHATYHSKLTEGEQCKAVMITKDQYLRLVKYVDESFLQDEKGMPINIVTNANYGDNDAFYEATGSYSLFHTCNTWTNSGLKSCGQKACVWTPFAGGIFYHYRK